MKSLIGYGLVNQSLGTGFQLLANSQLFTSGTESSKQITYAVPGVLSDLFMNVITNTASGANTIIIRKNNANGNLTVSVTASTTGLFSDNVHKDVIAVGDILNVKSTASLTATYCTVGVFFTASVNNTASVYACSGTRSVSAGGASLFTPLGGQLTSHASATESNTQIKIKTAGVLSNVGVVVTANAAPNATTVVSRKNTANGNCSASIPASSTGEFQDNVNTDSVAVNDLINVAVVPGAGAAETTTCSIVYIWLQSQTSIYFGVLSSNGAYAANTTFFPLPWGSGSAASWSTEASDQGASYGQRMSVSNIICLITTNSVTAASTMTLRIDGANGNNTFSIGSSSTGYFEDTTHTDYIGYASKFCYQLVTGATGTSLSMLILGALVSIPNDMGIKGNSSLRPRVTAPGLAR